MAVELDEPGLEARAALYRRIALALIVVTLIVPIALTTNDYLTRGGAANCFTQSLLVALIGYGVVWVVTRGDRLPKRRSRGYVLVALLVIVLATENIPKGHEADQLTSQAEPPAQAASSP